MRVFQGTTCHSLAVDLGLQVKVRTPLLDVRGRRVDVESGDLGDLCARRVNLRADELEAAAAGLDETRIRIESLTLSGILGASFRARGGDAAESLKDFVHHSSPTPIPSSRPATAPRAATTRTTRHRSSPQARLSAGAAGYAKDYLVKRISWDDLPDELKAAIEKRTGRILEAHTATAGQNSPIAATITTEHGKTFVKGLPRSENRSTSQAREIAVAPLVRGISPHLHWHFEEDGWIVLGYQHIEGRHADYRPGSGDPEALLPILTALGEIKVPTGSGPFKLAEDRWKTYVDDPEELEIFRGATLQHTDWISHNVLISPDRPYLVDWAWPTLGAAWMDPAYFLIRLMASGHSAEDAESFAAQIPAFANADPSDLDAFARVNVRMWDEIEVQSAEHISSWMRGVVSGSRDWAKHRGVAVSPT